MFLDEIKNLELRDLLQAWEDDFRGALDLTIYKNELEIIDEFLDMIWNSIFQGEYLREEIKIRYDYYEKFYQIKRKYYS